MGVWDDNFAGVWHMEETSGVTIADSTIRNNVGTKRAETEPNPSTSGQIAGAQTFDGNNDYVQVGTSSTLNPSSAMTVDAWVFISNNSNYGTIFGRWNNSTNSYWIGTNPSTSQVAVYFSGSLIYTTSSFPVDQWVKISVAHSGSAVSVYKDGVYLGGGNSGSITASSIYTSIGYDYNRTNYPFRSKIDEVRVSNIARSAAWIAAYIILNLMTLIPLVLRKVYPSKFRYLISNVFDSGFSSDWGTATFTTSGTGTVTVKVRTDSSYDMSTATAWGTCSAVSSGSDFSSNDCVTDTDRYVQYQVLYSLQEAVHLFLKICVLLFQHQTRIHPLPTQPLQQ